MALKEIKIFPDPILREKASRIEKVTDAIVQLSEDMVETMRLANGAGIAANQVGVALRLIIVDTQVNKESRPLILINPEIVLAESEEDTVEEGCLSVPKFYEFVKRPRCVKVRAVDLRGEVIEMDCEDHMARAMQHEIDHLNGILFVDRLSPIKKEFFKKTYLRAKK